VTKIHAHGSSSIGRSEAAQQGNLAYTPHGKVLSDAATALLNPTGSRSAIGAAQPVSDEAMKAVYATAIATKPK
jgi:hypothetical protein